jgi:hypothetical protein
MIQSPSSHPGYATKIVTQHKMYAFVSDHGSSCGNSDSRGRLISMKIVTLGHAIYSLHEHESEILFTTYDLLFPTT